MTLCFGLAFPGVAHPLSDAAATALFTVLRNTPQRVMASYALDAFVLHLRASSAPYDAVWKGTYVALACILVVQVLCGPKLLAWVMAVSLMG